jgi:phosphatidylserine decarboxylase
MMSEITVSPPKFYAAEITGVPFYAIFMDFLDNRWGQAFFSNPIVNRHLRNIFNEYQTMLKSEVSNTHMNDGPGGWFSQGKGPVGNECGKDSSGVEYEKGAACFYDFEDYYIDKNEPNWGFDNWNDWFTRPLKAGRRPIDEATNVIVNSSDSYPLYYPPNSTSEVTGQNPAKNVSTEAHFWLKDNQYSLYDMLGARQMGITDLVDHAFKNGTVYQAFLNPWCYHRWHTPV